MVGVVTKSRVGFSMAVVTVITTAGCVIVRQLNASGRDAATACSLLALAGLASVIRGRFRAAEAAEWTRKDRVSTSSEDDDNPLEFLKRYTYWGMMLLLSALLIYLTSALLRTKTKPLPLEPRPVAKRAVVAKAPVAFPALKLEGLDYNGDKSLALIDGVTVGVGESIGSVKLVEIGRDYVKVAMDGETKMLRLGY